MKHLLIPILLLAALVADAQSVGKKYVLKKVIEVQGRQGITIAISVYDAETLQWKRDLPWIRFYGSGCFECD